MTLDLDAFGALLRAARERRDLRAIDLAVAMRWAGTAPVYRYERGGPDAPRPDPDTINQLAQVLELGYADRITLLGLAGHLPDTQPLSPDEEARLIAAVRPELERLAEPALVFDYRGRVLAVGPTLADEVSFPAVPPPGAVPALGGPTVFDLVWDPALGLADRLVHPDAVRRFQVLRFQLFNQLRRHEAWYRAIPDRFGHYAGFRDLWHAAESQLTDDGSWIGLLPVVNALTSVRFPDGGIRSYDISQRTVHGSGGLVATLVMSPVGEAAASP